MTAPTLVSADQLEALAFRHARPIEFADGYGFVTIGSATFRSVTRVGGAR